MKNFRVIYKENDLTGVKYTIQERCLFFWFDLCRVSTLDAAIEHIRWCKEDRNLSPKKTVVHME